MRFRFRSVLPWTGASRVLALAALALAGASAVAAQERRPHERPAGPPVPAAELAEIVSRPAAVPAGAGPASVARP